MFTSDKEILSLPFTGTGTVEYLLEFNYMLADALDARN
jgi:hypothetical protein